MWSQWFTLEKVTAYGITGEMLLCWQEAGYAIMAERYDESNAKHLMVTIRSFNGMREEVAQIDATVRHVLSGRPKRGR